MRKIIAIFVIIIFMFNVIGCGSAPIKENKQNKLSNENISINEIKDLKNKIKDISYRNWLFNSQLILDPFLYVLWVKNYDNYDIALLSFSWPVRTKLQYLLDFEYRSYEKYVHLVPTVYMENNSFFPDLLLYATIFIQIVRWHELTSNNIGDKSLILIPGIPALLLGHCLGNENNKISTTIEYLNGITEFENIKELSMKDIYYVNKFNQKYMKYKKILPEVSEDLMNRANFYINLKDYLLPSLALGISLFDFIQHINNDRFKDSKNLTFTFPFLLLPGIILPFFDSEYNLYDKYKEIVPEIYNDRTGYNFLLLVLASLIDGGRYYNIFTNKSNVDPVTIGLIAITSLSISIYFDWEQREKYKTIKYIYKMQKYEKKELLND